VYVRRRITFSRELQLDRGLVNAAIWLVNPPIADPAHGSGVLSFVYLILVSPLGRFVIAEGIRQAHIDSAEPVSIRAHLRNVFRNLGPAVKFALGFGYKRFVKRGRKVPGFFVPSAVNTYPLLYHGEHIPHAESHVRATSERDALGVPRLETRLWFSDEDVQSVLRAHRELDAYLREHDLGYVEYLYDDCEAAVRKQLFGGYHQAGTTRMSSCPEDGVVDKRLAVHGFDDLYVASGSTFVTSGQANTTFMIVAFALRLADELHRQLVRPSTGSNGRRPVESAVTPPGRAPT
ncbi:MAG TPA: GMC family oxidoreductase, partial [Solirubrobacteraceae bacterium]